MAIKKTIKEKTTKEIQYRVIRPFVYKGKIYKLRSFFDKNDPIGIRINLAKNLIFRISIEEKEEQGKRPTTNELGEENKRLKKIQDKKQVEPKVEPKKEIKPETKKKTTKKKKKTTKKKKKRS